MVDVRQFLLLVQVNHASANHLTWPHLAPPDPHNEVCCGTRGVDICLDSSICDSACLHRIVCLDVYVIVVLDSSRNIDVSETSTWWFSWIWHGCVNNEHIPERCTSAASEAADVNVNDIDMNIDMASSLTSAAPVLIHMSSSSVT